MSLATDAHVTLPVAVAEPRRVAILQPSYIPWKGYFDIIAGVDEFILYDDAQFDKGGWRNRNRIRTPQGVLWLTIPVRRDGRRPLYQVRVDSPRWARLHWRSIATYYRRAPHFAALAPRLEALYEQAARLELLGPICALFLRAICGWLGLTTRLTSSRDYRLDGDRVGRLLGLCQQASAGVYLTGPAARSYLDESRFAAAGVAVRYMDYRGYPEYEQRFAPCIHEVSIVDLLLNVGVAAARRHLIGALAQ